MYTTYTTALLGFLIQLHLPISWATLHFWERDLIRQNARLEKLGLLGLGEVVSKHRWVLKHLSLDNHETWLHARLIIAIVFGI